VSHRGDYDAEAVDELVLELDPGAQKRPRRITAAAVRVTSVVPRTTYESELTAGVISRSPPPEANTKARFVARKSFTVVVALPAKLVMVNVRFIFTHASPLVCTSATRYSVFGTAFLRFTVAVTVPKEPGPIVAVLLPGVPVLSNTPVMHEKIAGGDFRKATVVGSGELTCPCAPCSALPG
jgi:hypothetical protein